MAKILIIGTSNCLLNGGIKDAIEEFFGRENVTNLSLGATSGTDLALFRLIEGLDLTQFDYVLFDSIINETWQVIAGRSIDHLWSMARALYSLLPARVTYCYLAFSTKLNFFHPNDVERIHRELCREFEINFISFREILIDLAYRFEIPLDQLYQPNDLGHFSLALIKKVALKTFELFEKLPKKICEPSLSIDRFFVFDLRLLEQERISYSTTLRSQEYVILKPGDRITLPSGSFLGFDFTEIGTASYIFVCGTTQTSKLLSFDADRPWMRVTTFHQEIITGEGSYLECLSRSPAGVAIEQTEANRVLDYPLSGIAKIANLYFAKRSFNDLIAESHCRRPSVFVPEVALEEEVSLALQEEKSDFLSAAYCDPL